MLTEHNTRNDYQPQDTEGDNLLEVLSLLGQVRCKTFSARDVIYRESDPVNKAVVVTRGMVKLLSYLPNGRARIVGLHNRNTLLGLEGLVGQPYEHTAIAVNDVEVAQIPIDKLSRLEQSDPQRFCRVLKQGYRSLSQADRWIADFSTGGIKPRVARLVDFLSHIEYGGRSNTVELLTVNEMADMLGVTPESVSRVLAEYKRNDTLRKVGDRMGMEEIYEINQGRLQLEARQ